MRATLDFSLDLIKEKISQIFVDVAQERVNRDKTCVMCDV